MSLSIRIITYLLISCFIISCQPDKKEKQNKKDTPSLQSQPKVTISSFIDAAFEGNAAIINQAIEENISIDIENENGATPLMLSAFNGHSEIVKSLLEKGAHVNHKDKNGRTALMYASSGPANETVKLLIDYKAQLDIQDSVELFTAIMFAASEGQVEVFKTLRDAGANEDLLDKDGEGIEDFANANKHQEILNLLIDK